MGLSSHLRRVVRIDRPARRQEGLALSHSPSTRTRRPWRRGLFFCRVAAGHCCPAAPSEPGVRIAPYPAQAILQHHGVAPNSLTERRAARRRARYSVHSGSNGCAAPGTLTWRVIATVDARKSCRPTVVPSAAPFVAKAQDLAPLCRKYRLMTHRAPLVGCLRTDHRQSICQMCVSMSEKVAFAAA